MGKTFLVVVDAHSKWLEVEMFPSASSSNTIAKLRTMFATHGLPIWWFQTMELPSPVQNSEVF